MSVLKKLKGTFQNAQQDIVDGLRALTSLDNHNRLEQQLSLKSREIRLDTGADLLHGYQTNWSSIQTETGESAKRAEEVTTLIMPLFKVWEQHTQSLTRLEEEVKTIPVVLTMLTELHNLLDGLSQTFIAAEKELMMLENICDEQEFHKRCLEEHKKLAAYKVQKETEADRAKVELAQSHAKKMAMLETAKKKSLQERAEAFTSAFQNDLDFYRTHGHPGRIPTEFPKVSSLSDIDLDQDKKDLDSFLGPSPVEETDSITGSLELSGEGAYIEDDYTTDFSVKQDTDFQDDYTTDFSVKQDTDFQDDYTTDFSVKQDTDVQDNSNNTRAAIIRQLQLEDESGENSYAQRTVTSDLSSNTKTNNHNLEESSGEADNLSTADNLHTTQIDVSNDNVEAKSENNIVETESFPTALETVGFSET